MILASCGAPSEAFRASEYPEQKTPLAGSFLFKGLPIRLKPSPELEVQEFLPRIIVR